MKKRSAFVISALLATTTALGFTSCNNDDENGPNAPAATIVQGSYQGDMTCTVMGDESVFENMTFTVTAVDDATANVAVSTFGNPPMQIAGITIYGMSVSVVDGHYILSETNFSGESNGKTYSGVAQGNCTGNQLTMQFNLKYGAMPMPLICSFTATKQFQE